LGLDISGSLNKVAKLDVDGELFYSHESLLHEIASPFGISVGVEVYGDGRGYMFVIHNKTGGIYSSIYADEVFEGLHIESDDTFEQRANDFITKIETDERLEDFKNLEFSDVGKRYFVSS
jgi:hypothetical protein